jgi:hypothetical protein
MGEHDRRSIIWDHIEIFTPGVVWEGTVPPVPLYKGGPVYKVIAPVRDALAQAVGETHPRE